MEYLKVKYLTEDGTIHGREYTYKSDEHYAPGSVLLVPVKDSTTKAIVTEVDVPESEVESFKDKVKTIPMFSLVAEPVEPEVTATTGEPAVVPVDNGGSAELPLPQDTQVGHAVIHYTPIAEDSEMTRYIAMTTWMYGEVESFVVKDTESQLEATRILGEINKLKRGIAARKTELLKPIKDGLDRFSDSFKDIMKPVVDADFLMRQKILSYQAAEKEHRDAIDRAVRLEAEAAAARAQAEGKVAPAMPVPIQHKPDTHIVSDGGSSATTAMITKYEVTDFAALPDYYKMPDTGKLSKAVKAGGPSLSIPGVRIYQEPILRVRS